MARWDPEAEARLRAAAIDLFLEAGYDDVTVAQIAERAGLNRRTFSRYFADKRDVLFAGSDRLPGLLADRLRGVDAALAPLDAVVVALLDLAPDLAAAVAPLAAQRRAIIATSPELQERGLAKFAAVADAIGAVLRERGADEPSARLIAEVGVALFRGGFDRWSQDPAGEDLAACIRDAAATLAGATTGD